MKNLIAVAVLMAAAVAGAQQHKAAGDASSQLPDIERKWAESEVKHDPAMIAPYLAETLVETDEGGNLLTRQQVLDGISKPDPALKNVEVSDLQVHSYGNAAVITGRYVETREENGKQSTVSGRFTDTYVRQGGKWQCVASHDSASSS